MYQIKSHNEDETKELARLLASFTEASTIITLEGNLGAGKTTFVKGFAKGLGIKRAITSPTFTIMKQYEGKLPLYHMDVYRLEFSEEESGLDDYIFGDGVAIIEWAQFIEDDLPKERLAIQIDYNGEDERIIKLLPVGNNYEEMTEQFINKWGKHYEYIND